MKTILREFIDWLEQAHFRRGLCGSPFEQPVSSVLVLKAEAALARALASGQPVTLFTTTVNARALLAGLVFRRSGVSIQNVFQANLDDGDFDRLTRCLAQVNRSGLELVEGEPSATLRAAAFFGAPIFAVIPT